jgi:G3E family GTPase
MAMPLNQQWDSISTNTEYIMNIFLSNSMKTSIEDLREIVKEINPEVMIYDRDDKRKLVQYIKNDLYRKWDERKKWAENTAKTEGQETVAKIDLKEMYNRMLLLSEKTLRYSTKTELMMKTILKRCMETTRRINAGVDVLTMALEDSSLETLSDLQRNMQEATDDETRHEHFKKFLYGKGYGESEKRKAVLDKVMKDLESLGQLIISCGGFMNRLDYIGMLIQFRHIELLLDEQDTADTR